MKRELFVLFTSAVLLIGCGGGGGGGGTPTPQSLYSGSTSAVVIDGTNIGEVASAGYESSSLMWDINMPTVVGVVTTAGETERVRLTEITDRLTDFVYGLESGEGALLAGATVNETGSCTNGGSVRIRGDISNPVASGDYLNITFYNCNEGGVVFDGVFSLVFNNVPSDLINPPIPWELVASYSFDRLTTSFSGGSILMHGGFTFTLGEDSADTGHGRMQGNALYVRAGAEEALLTNFDFWMSYDDFQSLGVMESDFTVASTELGGVITVNTTVPFGQYSSNDYPHVGAMTISSATGATVWLTTVDATQVFLEWDITAPFDGVEGNATRLWAELDSFTIPAP
jgi:hypothetical protein